MRIVSTPKLVDVNYGVVQFVLRNFLLIKMFARRTDTNVYARADDNVICSHLSKCEKYRTLGFINLQDSELFYCICWTNLGLCWLFSFNVGLLPLLRLVIHWLHVGGWHSRIDPSSEWETHRKNEFDCSIYRWLFNRGFTPSTGIIHRNIAHLGILCRNGLPVTVILLWTVRFVFDRPPPNFKKMLPFVTSIEPPIHELPDKYINASFYSATKTLSCQAYCLATENA